MKPRVVIGPVGKLIREGLVASCRTAFDLRSVDARGLPLLQRAQALGAAAVIADPKDVGVMSGALPDDMLLIGISYETTAMLVCWGSHDVQFASADTNGIIDLVRTWVSRTPTFRAPSISKVTSITRGRSA